MRRRSSAQCSAAHRLEMCTYLSYQLPGGNKKIEGTGIRSLVRSSHSAKICSAIHDIWICSGVG